MTGKAIKKPVEIDWFKWNNNIDELTNWINIFDDLLYDHFIHSIGNPINLLVKTLEGTSYNVPDNYIIIRGIKGEYYPCDPRIFEETYNVTED